MACCLTAPIMTKTPSIVMPYAVMRPQWVECISTCATLGYFAADCFQRKFLINNKYWETTKDSKMIHLLYDDHECQYLQLGQLGPTKITEMENMPYSDDAMDSPSVLSIMASYKPVVNTSIRKFSHWNDQWGVDVIIANPFLRVRWADVMVVCIFSHTEAILLLWEQHWDHCKPHF